MRRVAEDDDDVAENHRPSHPFGDLTLRHRRDLSALRARTLCECPAPPVWTAGRSAADGGGKGRESGGGTTVSLRQGHRRARMSDVEMADMKLSFACPLLLRRVVHPARGRLCRHLQAVGAEGLLEMYAFKPSVRCTVCNVEIATDELIIDAQFLRLLQKYRGQDGCMVSPDGSDRPLPDASRTPPSGSRKRPLSSCREVDDDVVDDDDDDNEDRLGRYHRHLGDSDDDNQGCEREAAVGGGGGGGGGGSGSGIEKMLDVVLVLDDDDDGDGDCAMRDA
ncbi:hypothetical protein DFJ73DRAFT_259772 [Zopfochytrium polystomum]|nr:hypothetical protein DFJ73DRAFT_259772 [Zopfochytrium polystomum]